MLKLYVFLFVFAVATSEVDIEQFYGQWLPIISYPNNKMAFLSICDRQQIARKNTTEQCKCGDRDNIPIVEITNVVNRYKVSFPVLTVNSSAEVAPALLTKCKCGGESKRHIVFRPVNENYFIEYEHQYGMEHQYSKEEPNTANLFVKKLPRISELKVMSTYDDLSDRVGSVLCSAELLANETLHNLPQN